MRELSIFVDESGGQRGRSRFYLLTLVMHDQDDCIAEKIESYERSLKSKGLPDIPFHASPLINGHDDYEGLAPEVRSRLLSSFNVFVQRLPILYKPFSYKRSEVATTEALSMRMKRDISSFIFDNLAFFQSFDKVKIYYDDGQQVVSGALRESIGFVLSKEAAMFKRTKFADYRLAQVADYLCAVELTALKFEENAQTATDEKFFGRVGAFKKNYLKQARRKLMG